MPFTINVFGSWSSRIVYIDCNAGRGKHATGHSGSPLLALEAFLQHPTRDRILKNCEVRFIFIEADRENKEALEKNLSEYRIPQKVIVTAEHGQFEEVLHNLINQLNEKKASWHLHLFLLIRMASNYQENSFSNLTRQSLYPQKADN
jgi:three-Cys-motif partner protein